MCAPAATGRIARPLSRAGEGQGEGSGLSGRGAPCRRVDRVLDPERSRPSPPPSPARERGRVAPVWTGVVAEPVRFIGAAPRKRGIRIIRDRAAGTER
ncbi:hypothetical protein CIW48_15825 [Methylobacterium sp. P1-11]|nr:hypothetical protein CIW48_15825 [Methylobacterium sp. P1-11]